VSIKPKQVKTIEKKREKKLDDSEGE